MTDTSDTPTEPLSGTELLNFLGTDAERWTKAFVEAVQAAPEGLDDQPGGLVHGWFANAIGAGESRGYAKAHEEPSQALLDALAPAVVPKSKALKDYKLGDPVIVVGTRSKNEVTGIVSGVGNHLVVDTPEGTTSIGNPSRIRPQ